MSLPSLSTYIGSLRPILTRAAPSPLTIVLGNPSCDLDSFISAILFSYFYSTHSGSPNLASPSRRYVPLLNLPGTRSTDLWRLRPEFGVALRLALGEHPSQIDEPKRTTNPNDSKTKILEGLITLGDILADQNHALHTTFSPAPDSTTVLPKQDTVLVDHNAPSIPGLTDATIHDRLNITGVVDHHIDEHAVPASAQPHIVTPGIGSCTSLVVQHLRTASLWPSSPAGPIDNDLPLVQLARLALAAILIDTSNLHGTGDKCAPLDRTTVAFLESHLPPGSWDRDASHAVLARTKANSLDLLGMQEILARDYKAWSETCRGGHQIEVGIASLVRPVSWLVKHAGGAEAFAEEVQKYARDEGLGVFGMLTRKGDRKEVVIIVLDEAEQAEGAATGAVERFVGLGGELKLAPWSDEDGMGVEEALDSAFGPAGKGWAAWWMGDTSKSRKQVGPMLREAVRSS